MKPSTRNKLIIAMIAIGLFSYLTIGSMKQGVERQEEYAQKLQMIKTVWGDEKFSEEKWRKETPEERGKMCYDFLVHCQSCYVTQRIDDLYFPVRLGNNAIIDLPSKDLFCWYIGNEKCKGKDGKYIYKHALCFYISYRWGPPRRVGGADVMDMAEIGLYPSTCKN